MIITNVEEVVINIVSVLLTIIINNLVIKQRITAYVILIRYNNVLILLRP